MNPAAPSLVERISTSIQAIRRAKALQQRNPSDPTGIRPAIWVCGVPVMAVLIVVGCLVSAWALLGTVCVGGLMYVVERKRETLVSHWSQEIQSARKDAETARLFLASIEDRSALHSVLSVRDTELDEDSVAFPTELYPVIERLLPRVDTETYFRLTDYHRTRLRSFIDIYYSLSHADLLIEVLRLVERARDTRSIPLVERLTEDPVVTTGGLRVKDTAKAVLPTLKEAARKNRAEDRLLRPASEPEGILLRPAGGSNDADDQTLLRPTPQD